MGTDTRPAAPKPASARTYQQSVNGDWTPSSAGQTYTRENPANGAPVETIPWGGVEDARKAIDAARAAFDAGSWAKAPAAQRANVLRQVAAKIRAELGREGLEEYMETKAIQIKLN